MRRIAFVSGKGGVGKTTLSLNVSFSIQKDFKRKVLLMDLNYQSKNIPVLVRSLLKSGKSLPISYKKKKYPEFSGNYDITIIDMPPGYKHVVRTFSEDIEYVVVVTPDILSVTDAKYLVNELKDLDANILGVVVNRRENKSYELSTFQIKKVLKLPILAEIPEDKKVKEAFFYGVPVVEYDPTSPASREIRRLGARFLGYKWNPPKKGFLSRILGLFS